MIFEINEKSRNGIKYIFLLLPALYLFKLNISTLIISILPLIFFLLKFNIQKNLLPGIYLVFFFYLLAHSIFFKNLNEFYYLRFLFFLLVFVSIIQFNDLKLFYKYLFLTILVIFTDVILQLFLGYNLFGYQKHPDYITSFFDDEKILGSYAVKMLVLLIFAKLFESEKSKKLQFLFNSSIISIPLIVFLSGERAALLALILLVLYFVFYLYKDQRFRFLYKSSIALFILILIFLLNSNTYYDRYVNNTISSLFDANYSQNKDQLPEEIRSRYKIFFLSAQHQNYLITSLNIYNQNKIVGSGPKSFRYACKEKKVNINFYSCGTHPHNYYLQLLSETGIIGFTYFVLIYLYIIFKSVFNLKNLYFKNKYNFYEITLLGYFFVQFWPINQTANLFNNYNSIFILLPLSIYLSLKRNKTL